MKFFITQRQLGYLRSAKTILFGVVLSILAGMPLLSNLLSDKIDYSETTKEVTLMPGRNQIDDVTIMLSQDARVIHAEQTHRQVHHTFLGFRNRRVFLIGGMPFLSLLGFCVFFFWYDKQPKTSYLLTLKSYTWRVFSFVSLWFLYRITTSKPVHFSYVFYLLGIYLLTGISMAFVHYSYRYYCNSFRHKHRKIAGLTSYIFELQYKHYPRMARKALHLVQAQQQTHQHIQAYESQTFNALDGFNATPTVRNAESARVKLILIGLLLLALAVAPLMYQFASRHVDYVETTETVFLAPGLNKIGSLSLTLGEHGKVLKAQKTERQTTHEFFHYENAKVFLANAAPFFTSLILCLFLFWYEQQQKNPHVLALKRYVLTIFFLVSLWCSCWALLPGINPIPENLFYIGTFVVLCVGIASLQYLYRHNGGDFMRFYSKLRGLVVYIFEVRREHYPTIARRALEVRETHEDTCDEIDLFDYCSTLALVKILRESNVPDPDLRKDLLDFSEHLLQRLLNGKRVKKKSSAQRYIDKLIKWRKKNRGKDKKD